MNAAERERLIGAYHDGELSWLDRLRVRRLLGRDDLARAEVESLSTLGGLLREIDAEAPGPDLWEAVRMRLPAADARRAEAAETPGSGPRWIGAGFATAAAALALAVVVQLGPPAAAGAVRWLDSNGKPVFVLQDDRDATIIWLLDAPTDGLSNSSSRRSDRAVS